MEIPIVINAREIRVAVETISYEDVVRFAIEDEAPTDLLYTVVFCRGPFKRHEGTLAPGESVKVVPGMVFSAHYTGSA